MAPLGDTYVCGVSSSSMGNTQLKHRTSMGWLLIGVLVSAA